VPEKAEDLEARASEAGRLVIVGSGITAISHLTFETVGHIRRADVIIYHAIPMRWTYTNITARAKSARSPTCRWLN
jgi:siroheme synthase